MMLQFVSFIELLFFIQELHIKPKLDWSCNMI